MGGRRGNPRARMEVYGAEHEADRERCRAPVESRRQSAPGLPPIADSVGRSREEIRDRNPGQQPLYLTSPDAATRGLVFLPPFEQRSDSSAEFAGLVESLVEGQIRVAVDDGLVNFGPESIFRAHTNSGEDRDGRFSSGKVEHEIVN